MTLSVGRMFDKDGNMRQWWTNRTVAEYVNRTGCFTKQYSEYYVKEVEDNVSAPARFLASPTNR